MPNNCALESRLLFEKKLSLTGNALALEGKEWIPVFWSQAPLLSLPTKFASPFPHMQYTNVLYFTESIKELEDDCNSLQSEKGTLEEESKMLRVKIEELQELYDQKKMDMQT